jgi:O-antigen/teichoic acid export membrane protein
MSQGDIMRRGAAWVFAGKSGDQIVTFAFGIVLARLLSPEIFGTLLTIQVFTGLAGFVAGGGMGQALVRAKSVTKLDYDVVFTLQLIIGCLIYALFFLSAPLFARWYQTPIYADLLRLAALTFIFRPLINVPMNILYRGMRFKERTTTGLITLIVSSAVSTSLAYYGHGVWSLIWGGIIGALAQSVLLMHASRWRPRLSFNFWHGAEMARYGILVSANDILDYARSQINIFIISRSLGPTSVGLYNKGENLAGMPFRFVAGSVYQILFRAMAAEQGNLDKCRYMYFRSIALVAVYATPFYVALIWLAEPLVRGVYGDKWVAAAGPLFILVFAWPFLLLENLSGAAVAALNRLGQEFRLKVPVLAFTAVAVWFSLPWGIDGVAWAMVASTALSCVLMLRLALQTLKAHWRDVSRALSPAVGLNAMLATTLLGCEQVLPQTVLKHDLLHVAILGGAGGLVYAAGLIFVPIKALAAERARWRTLLCFPAGPQP